MTAFVRRHGDRAIAAMLTLVVALASGCAVKLAPGYDRTLVDGLAEAKESDAYDGVPDRSKLGCDWPYAVRRYDGSGVNSYHYQYQVLRRLPRLPGDA